MINIISVLLRYKRTHDFWSKFDVSSLKCDILSTQFKA